jgi:molecular chaperone GrpE (heat shock protein)
VGINRLSILLTAIIAIIIVAVIAMAIIVPNTSDVPKSPHGQSAENVTQQIEPPPKDIIRSGATAKTEDSIEPSKTVQNASPLIFIALLAMAIVTLLAVSISFYLYRWRRFLHNNRQFSAPGEFEVWANGLNNTVVGLMEQVEKFVQHFDLKGTETHQRVANLSETFMTMQGALDEREKEIRRLKQGYDQHIYRKFVSRFIRVDQTIEDFQRAGGADEESLGQLRRLLGDAFEECGVECFQPELGDDYRECEGVADNPKTENGDRPEDAFKIVEVLESGYLIRGAEAADILIPAKVKILTFHKEEVS